MFSGTSGRLGPLCPLCSAPLRQQARSCPRCGANLQLPPELQWGLLTVFGYGVCGFMAGAAIGLAAALLLAGPWLRQWAVLAPLGLGVAGAILAAQVGKRLTPAVRCAYEHLLLAADCAGIVVVTASLCGLQALQILLLAWISVVLSAFLLLRRYGYQKGC